MSAAATATQPSLPPDIRLMNAVSALLIAGLLLAGVGLLLHKLLRLPVFGIRLIQVEGDVSRNSVASLRANALPQLAGNFLTLDLQQGRKAFEAVPWVRQAQLERVWPQQIRVTLQEHQAAAYWETRPDGADAHSEAVGEAGGERALVNSFGEVFEANLGDVEDERLPVLAGPAGKAEAMLTMWRGLARLSQPLQESVERLDLSGRGSWRLTLERGAVVELGRGTADEVLARYAAFVHSIGAITAHYQAPLLGADLRHPEGYAVRLRGISTTPGPVKGKVTKKA